MQKIKPTYAIALALVSLTSYTMPAKAQSDVAVNNPDRLETYFVQPQLPDNGAPTGRRKGAAGRGNCTLEQPLTALVPAIEKLTEDGAKATYIWGKTIAEYPTFWFYVPYSATSLRSVEFVLQEGEEDVYRTPVTLPKTPGIVSLRLPSTKKPLEVGKMYNWFFKVNLDCAPRQAAYSQDSVEGWVQRIELNSSLTKQLETATPQQRIAIYAANGIWYEALSAIASLRKLETPTFKDYWTELLHSAGLSDIASKPIVQCCNFENTYSWQGIRSVNP